jgi:hypothetical protein
MTSPTRPKKAASRKAARKPPASKSSCGGGGPTKIPPSEGGTLIERIVTAPQLIVPEAAAANIAKWLADLPETEAEPLEALLAAHPTVKLLLESLSESSPFLWELASREPARTRT